MKKNIFILILLIIFILVSCSEKPIDTNETDDPPMTEAPDENTKPTDDLPNNEDDLPENNNQNDTEGDLSVLIEEIYVDGFYYGNSNGNLNNQGLAVYSYSNKLHYYSSGKAIYSFNPENSQTNSIYEFEAGRPIYLNVTANNLYFINSLSGHVFNYDLTAKTIETINENENLYLYVDDFIYTLQSIETNQISNINYFCYRLKNYTLLHHDFSKIKFFSVNNNIVYYMTTNELTLRLMNYNGKGKTNLGYLNDLEVEEIFELIMYKKVEHVEYYMLTATINNTTGLYLYDTSNEEFEIILNGSMHSLNYHNNSIFVVKEDNLYEIPFATLNPNLLIEGLEDKIDLQVINNWLYIGLNNSNALYQIHPITKEVKNLT